MSSPNTDSSGYSPSRSSLIGTARSQAFHPYIKTEPMSHDDGVPTPIPYRDVTPASAPTTVTKFERTNGENDTSVRACSTPHTGPPPQPPPPLVPANPPPPIHSRPPSHPQPTVYYPPLPPHAGSAATSLSGYYATPLHIDSTAGIPHHYRSSTQTTSQTKTKLRASDLASLQSTVDLNEFYDKYRKWINDLTSDGLDMSCFYFDFNKGGIFCKICIAANKAGGFTTKPAIEQARRVLTKHMERDKHKSAVEALKLRGMALSSIVNQPPIDHIAQHGKPPKIKVRSPVKVSSHNHCTSSNVSTNSTSSNNSNTTATTASSSSTRDVVKKEHAHQSAVNERVKTFKNNLMTGNAAIPPSAAHSGSSSTAAYASMTALAANGHSVTSSSSSHRPQALGYSRRDSGGAPPLPPQSQPPQLSYYYYSGANSSAAPPPPHSNGAMHYRMHPSQHLPDRYIQPTGSPMDRALFAHLAVIHLMAKDSYELLLIKCLKKKKRVSGDDTETIQTALNEIEKRESIDELMDGCKIADINLDENKYRGHLTIAEFMGGPNSILYDAGYQSRGFAYELLTCLHNAAIRLTESVTNQSGNELKWLHRSLRMNSTGRGSLPLYHVALQVFHERRMAGNHITVEAANATAKKNNATSPQHSSPIKDSNAAKTQTIQTQPTQTDFGGQTDTQTKATVNTIDVPMVDAVTHPQTDTRV